MDEPTLNRYHDKLTDRNRTAQWLRIVEQIESPAFAQAGEKMPYLGSGAAVPLPGEPWPAQQQVEQFLESQRELLIQLHDAADDPVPVWLPIDFDDWMMHRQSLREAARLLQLEHDTAVYVGETEVAAQGIRSLLGLAESLQRDPFISHQLARIAIHGVAINALQRSIEQAPADVGDERAIADLLVRLSLFEDFGFPYRLAHAGERVGALLEFQEPNRFGGESRFVGSNSPARDCLVFLDFYQRSEQVAEEEDLDAFIRAAEQVQDKMVTEFAALGLIEQLGRRNTVGITEASTAFARALARQVMHTRMAKLAVGLRLYQHRFGDWPEHLSDLDQVGIAPETLVPLGDKPFGYRLKEGTAVLWGFEPTIDRFREVPDDPPPLDDWDADFHQRWVWRFPAKH